MINGSSQAKLFLGLVASLVSYIGFYGILVACGVLERSGGHIVIPAVFLAIGLQFLLLIYGLWKKKHWVSGKFLRIALVVILKVVLAFSFLGMDIPWVFLPGSLLLGALFYSLYHIAKIPSEYWTPKPHWIKRIFNISLVPNIFVLLTIVELILISFQLKPGAIFARNYFNKVDELVVKQDYESDESGIMVINAKGQELAATGLWEGKLKEVYGSDSSYSGSIHSVFTHYRSMREGKYENGYSKMLDSLKALPDSMKSALDSAYINTLIRPINLDGYRSIPFVPYTTSRPKVLLIGDSFTFGWSAEGWTDSFADLLAAKGYAVYNAGITGTDPAQYQAVAEKYIEQLHPDFVVANVYLGNDVVYSHREVSPERPIYCVTNAGVLMNAPTGEYIGSAEDAYQFYLRGNYINVDGDASGVERFAAKTVLGTALWRGMNQLRILYWLGKQPNQAYWERGAELLSQTPITEPHLIEIRNLSERHGANFLTIVIPTNVDPAPDIEHKFPDLFNELEYLLPQLSVEDFVSGNDGHYNNEGHQKHAAVLDAWMQSLWSQTEKGRTEVQP